MKKLNIAGGLLLAASSVLPAFGAAETLPYEITFDSSNYKTWQSIDDGQKDNFNNRQWVWKERSWFYSLVSDQKTPADD